MNIPTGSCLSGRFFRIGKCIPLTSGPFWRRKWQPTSVFLPVKSHGQRNLAGYSPWSRRVGHEWVTSPCCGWRSALFLSNEPLLVPDWSKWKCQDTSSFHVHELKWATYKFIELLDSLLIDWQMCHNVNNSNYIVCASSMETPWTVAHQAPLSMEFSRQEYWSGLPFHSPLDLPDPGVEPKSYALSSKFFTTEPTGKPLCGLLYVNYTSRKLFKKRS